MDAVGEFGPKFNAYKNTNGTKEGLVRLTPKGFPHKRQLEYLESKAPYTMWAGQRGSGKTYGAVWDNLFTAYLVPGCKQMIFRRTMAELSRTIIEEFLKLPEELRGHLNDNSMSPHLRLPNGSIIYFGSINDEKAARKQLGGELLKITFDEWCQLPYEWWSYVAGSARSPIDKDIL